MFTSYEPFHAAIPEDKLYKTFTENPNEYWKMILTDLPEDTGMFSDDLKNLLTGLF